MSSDPEAGAEEAILSLLHDRDPGKTICPSEAARVIAGEDDFRPHMAEVREAAGRLVARGRLEVTQGGSVVDLETARGPIRLRLPPEAPRGPASPTPA